MARLSGGAPYGDGWRGALLVVLSIAATAACAAAQVPCTPADTGEVEAALARIEASFDPCGESDQIRAVLDTLRHCAARTYRICIDPQTGRNVFDRPPTAGQADEPRTITWNPTLRTPLEDACDGDPNDPVLRDPTASLLHELAHAADDCRGLNPGTHELEAVRIENIYRRAAGLCQRSRYGDDPLPAAWVIACTPTHCACAGARPPAVEADEGAARPQTVTSLGLTGSRAADQRDSLSGTPSRD